jgi:hypothetical protein
VLERLLTFQYEEYDERWLLLDIDHRGAGPHVRDLAQTLSEARWQGVNAAICNPCFELWLLLHHKPESECRGFRNCAEVDRTLREALGEYNKRNLQPHRFAGSVLEACARARRLEENEAPEIPVGCAARVHRILEAIGAGAAPNQMPPELRGLIP